MGLFLREEARGFGVDLFGVWGGGLGGGGFGLACFVVLGFDSLVFGVGLSFFVFLDSSFVVKGADSCGCVGVGGFCGRFCVAWENLKSLMLIRSPSLLPCLGGL